MSPRNVVAAAVTSLALLIGSSSVAAADPIEDTAGEPANIGDAKTAAIAYHDSGQYQHDLAEVAAQAINWIHRLHPAHHGPAGCPVRIGGRLQGAPACRDRSPGIHDRREHRRSAV